MRTYISLFSSAGVGCYGFKEANFECVATNEILEKRLNIQRYNNKCKYDSGYLLGDIEDKKIEKQIIDEIKFWKKNEKINDIDVLIATPPCQGMSIANHKKKNEINRNSLIVQSVKLIKKIMPRYFIFENVKAFLNTICKTLDNRQITIDRLIDEELLSKFNILKKVINFKDYGSNSSRTRTIVIGIRKDIKNVSPEDIFPSKEEPKNLIDVIGDLPKLNVMGEIDKNDIFHSFRSYNKKMLPWIMNTKEGCSAFDNEKLEFRPHKVIDNKIVLNINKNGDKYTRCKWNSVMPCIHTRNDILASQSTIHPTDNRVFSIRELMRLMTIPDSFKWTYTNFCDLNNLTTEEKVNFLKKEEINIRKSIGEAVPTIIFRKIAENIKKYDKYGH